MKFLNTTTRYGGMSITLHWLMLALIAGVYGCILLSDAFPKGSDPRNALKTWHFMLGLLVFTLVWLRLIVRWVSPTPLIAPSVTRWQRSAAHGLHLALYGLMVGMPLLGWLMLSAANQPIPFFGLQLPPLVGPHKDWVDLLKEVHETGGSIGYFLIGLHAVAALYHHYFLHDNTLSRMLPWTKTT